MPTIKTTVAIIDVLNNVLHAVPDSELWQYDEGWNDARVAKDTGVTPGQVRGLRTQLKKKLLPRETAFERLVRLHNELANRTANGDLIFEYKHSDEE